MYLFRVIARLARLFLTIPENPIIRADAPWRRGIGTRLIYLVQVLIALGVFVGLMMSFAATAGFDPAYGLWYSGTPFLAVLFLPLIYVANLMILGERWRSPDRLHDLYLTNTSPAALAFGAVFWPIVAGSIIPLAGLAALMTTAVMSAFLEGGPAVYGLVQVSVTALYSPALLVLVICVSLGRWFPTRTVRARLLLIVPLYTFGYSLAMRFMSTLVFVSFFSFNETPVIAGVAIQTACMAIGALIALALPFWQAVHLAPSYFFSDVYPYPREELSSLDATRRFRREKALRRERKRRLREAVPIPWGATAMALGLMTGLTVLLAVGLFAAHFVPGFWPIVRMPVIHYLLNPIYLVFFFCGVSFLLFVRGVPRTAEGRPVLQKGNLMMGLVRPHIPVMMVTVVLAWAVCFFLWMRNWKHEGSEVAAFLLLKSVAALGPGLFMLFFHFVLLVTAHAFRRLLVGSAVCLVVLPFLSWLGFLFLKPGGLPVGGTYFPFQNPPMVVMGLSLLVPLVLAYLSPMTLQHLHVRLFHNRPLGALSSDEACEPGVLY